MTTTALPHGSSTTSIVMPANGQPMPLSPMEALQRAESDVMLRLAREFPRDEAAILKGALAELDLAPEEAGRAFYSIPYTDHATGRVVKVEGPTIRAAESLGRRWGHIKHGARIIHEDADGWDVEGVAVDLQTNTWVLRPLRISKWEKRRGGQVMLLDEKRAVMAVQSGISKAIRNAILAVLPAYLKSAYDKRARAIVGGGNLDAPTDAKTISAVRATFTKLGVTLEELERFAEKPVAEWTGNEIADLRGCWNAIQAGETTVAAAFRADSSEPGQTAGPAVVTPETLMGGVVTAEDQPPAPGMPGFTVTLQPPAPAPADAAPAPKRGRPRKATVPEIVDNFIEVVSPAPPPLGTTPEAVLRAIEVGQADALEALENSLLPSPVFAAWPREDRQRVIRALAQRQVALEMGGSRG